ncbi:MAG: efflux RND transporter periplasmic adaptor subunit [Candidatus Lambdaproteobacteria bacterium]|nr:efflux RND transporter periplasmic adaptor subunit [Candidatus Lambdaproteobacteria bacterium]
MLALGLLAGWGAPARAQALGPGEWVAAAQGKLEQLFPAVGTFLARQTVRVGAQVSGRVGRVLVDVGDRVKAHQELVRLEPEFFEIELAQRKAGLQQAQVALREAERNLERMRGLYEKPAGEAPSVPRKLFDDAQAAHDLALARVAEASFALKYSEQRFAETRVRAPFAAVVTRRMVDPGEAVTAAPIMPLLELQEVQTLRLEFALPQEMLARVRVGTPLYFDVAGASAGRAAARIGLIFPVIDPATRTFRCQALIDNGRLAYKPGMLVRVQVVEREIGDALVVPRGALAEGEQGWQVQVNQGGKAASRRVQVGLLTEQSAEIKSGLRPGERVWVPAQG